MSEALEQKKKQLQELVQRITISGSFDSVGLSRQLASLATEIQQLEKEDRSEQPGQLGPEQDANGEKLDR